MVRHVHRGRRQRSVLLAFAAALGPGKGGRVLGFIVEVRRKASCDRLRVDGLNGFSCIPREQKMLEGHLPRVIYHQVY